MKNGGHGESQPGDEDDDPELTAITRKLDETGDTRGAIDQLQELIVQRTGAIPVVTPEMLAAYRDPAPVAAAPREAEEIDWSIAPPAPLEPAPGFSEWVDPDAIAAAVDTGSRHEATDVSTKVFAVFSAERAEGGRPEAEAEAEAEVEAEDETEVEVEVETVDEDEVDGIDDLAEPEPEPERPQAAPAAPPQPPVRVEPPTPVPAKTYDEPLPPPVPPKKRRIWPFGRR